MSERPILYSAPMIRAKLAGVKTQTRRVVKLGARDEMRAGWPYDCLRHSLGRPMPCPYGRIGDKLWSRETYFAFGRWEIRFNAKKGRNEWHFIDLTIASGHRYAYAADGEPVGYRSRKRVAGVFDWWKRPAIFMPRQASRITDGIVSVRAERLHDISREDAISEGGPPAHPSIDSISRQFGFPDFPRSWYAQLWESINGPGSWALNPWVWVITTRPANV